MRKNKEIYICGGVIVDASYYYGIQALIERKLRFLRPDRLYKADELVGLFVTHDQQEAEDNLLADWCLKHLIKHERLPLSLLDCGYGNEPLYILK